MTRNQALAFSALTLIWGSTWISANALAEQIPPILGEATRFFLAALILLPLILLKHHQLPNKRQLRYLFLLSITMIVLPWLLLLWAARNLPSATVAVLFSATPLLVVLLTPLIADREIPRIVMPAAIAGVGAIAITMNANFSASQTAGATVLFLAVASTGASSLVASRELRTLHPVVTTAMLLAFSAALLFLASLAFERGQPAHWTRFSIAPILYLSVIGGAFAYALYFWLLQRIPPYQVATLQWLQPLVAMLEAALILRVPLSRTMLIGTAVTLVCVTQVIRAQTRDDDTVSLLRN